MMFDFFVIFVLIVGAFDYLHLLMNYHDQNYHPMCSHENLDVTMDDEWDLFGINLKLSEIKTNFSIKKMHFQLNNVFNYDKKWCHLNRSHL